MKGEQNKMRVVCIWRRESDYGRMVEEWIREFERRTGEEMESIDPDTRDGESLCRAYDVVEYPTILAIGEDGRMLDSWRGKNLPRFDEVSYWAHS